MSRAYAWFVGLFLGLQGLSTLAFRWWPSLDQAFPALLAHTQMVPAHSMLHIVTAALALWVLLVLVRQRPLALRRFALLCGLFYTGLALAGMVTGAPLGLGLQPFDHPFHLLLGGLGLLALAIDHWRDRAVRHRRP